MVRMLLLLIVLLLSLAPLAGCERGGEYRFGGGPEGGTFQIVAEGMGGLLTGEVPGTRVTVLRSGGSVSNLVDLERGALDLALVYAGDAYLGSQGRLDGVRATPQVRALARIYGASAQLAVRGDGPIRAPGDLRGKRVAVGNFGSGAALAAERYFGALGLWEEIVPVYYGYALATEDLSRGAVSAVWEMVGAPSRSLRELSRRLPVRLLDLEEAGRGGGFFAAYPFYGQAVIPAGTYEGQAQEVRTFGDAALWMAGPRVDADWAYRALAVLFSEGGLERMRRVHPAAQDMAQADGVAGVSIGLHPGAERFWRERGVLTGGTD